MDALQEEMHARWNTDGLHYDEIPARGLMVQWVQGRTEAMPFQDTRFSLLCARHMGRHYSEETERKLPLNRGLVPRQPWPCSVRQDSMLFLWCPKSGTAIMGRRSIPKRYTCSPV
ncbi:MAG: hypothetical protein LBC51_11390 [Treponema sp.]|jgi:hypothetical protein|nr:hypothetical protein [Treponema sp.]